MQGRNAPAAPWMVGLSIGLFATSATATAAPPRYRADPIAWPQGFWPRAMNASRTLAGRIDEGGFNEYTAATVAGGVVTPLDFGPGASSWLTNIADSGTVFGLLWPQGSPYRDERPFTASGGVVSPLPLPPADEWWREWTYLHMNNNEQFAGIVRGDNPFPTAARWDSRDADPVLLGNSPYGSHAAAMNDNGDVVVVQHTFPHWSVSSPDGASRDLELLDGVTFTEWDPLIINNAGEVAADAGPNKLLYWNAAGDLTVIGDDLMDITLAGMDDAGRVIWTDYDDATGLHRTHLWEDGVQVPLSSLVDGLDGQVLWTELMNSRGEILVHTTQGWAILVPLPAPHAACILIPGFAIAAQRRRRRQ